MISLKKLFMLFGYDNSFLPTVSYSILSRIKGRLGMRTDIDNYGALYGLIRIRNEKRKYLYESNSSFRKRIVDVIRDPKI